MPLTSWFVDHCCIGTGSLVAECHCGRTYFATIREGDYYSGELDKLRAQAQEKPDRYIECCDADYVHRLHFAGIEWVDECPCEVLEKYEGFIWNHRAAIARYLKARCESVIDEEQPVLANAEAVARQVLIRYG